MLLGYAALGKGFAYIGVYPVYVGELVLVIGFICLIVSVVPLRWVWSPTGLFLTVFIFWGLMTTIPSIPEYGTATLRDAVIWGYSLFAIATATFLQRLARLKELLARYNVFIRWYVLWVPIAVVFGQLFFDYIPRVPGSDVPLLFVKTGDFAVHIAGAAAFALLGLPALAPARRKGVASYEWVFWTSWFAGFTAVSSRTRGGFLAIVASVFVTLVVGRRSWRVKIPVVVAIILTVLGASTGVEINLGRTRDAISVPQLIVNVTEIVGGDPSEERAGTRVWRIAWWNKVIAYTVYGPYFWTGKGFGLNLAVDDGFTVSEEDTNRSPHNAHLTILARMGVPGFLVWSGLQLTFGWSLLLGFYKARCCGEEWLGRLLLWVFAYWLAFLVNGSFDVFLEGPQGGIWFWSLFGLGLALIEIVRSRCRPAISVQDASPYWS